MGDFFGVAEFGAEHGGHELHGEIGLQVTGLVTENRVGGGVGFVEAVAGKFIQDVEDRVGDFGFDRVDAFGALDKFYALGSHRFFVLLAHGAAQHIGAAEGVTGDDFGGLHDLLLVNHNAVGFAADILEELVRVSDGARIFFSAHVVGNPLHGAGAVERNEGDDFVDGGEPDLAAEILHAAGLELKHARGATRVEQGKGPGVLEGNRLNVEFRIDRAADVFDGVGDNGECLEAEEVHLQQSELADGVHVELHGDVAFLLCERDEFVEWTVGDDDTGGVFTGVADHAFEDERLVEDSFGDRIAGNFLAELLGFFAGGFERDVELVGNHLREPVSVGVR